MAVSKSVKKAKHAVTVAFAEAIIAKRITDVLANLQTIALLVACQELTTHVAMNVFLRAKNAMNIMELHAGLTPKLSKLDEMVHTIFKQNSKHRQLLSS